MNRIVVIGTSSGGLDALRELFVRLPAEFPAPICVVIHTSPHSPGVMHQVLGRSTALTVVTAKNLDPLVPRRAYIAPPDCHLLVEPGRVRLTKGPKENRFRPAIDPLFRTAAQVFGPAAIGVILTGNLDDGTAGLATIKQLGGTTIVQDPRDALFPSMPESALRHVKVDHCAPLDRIPGLLVELTRQPVTPSERPIPPDVDTEVRIAKEENPMNAGLEEIRKPSAFTCPDCHGVLLQLSDQDRVRFRCHTGHAYSLDSLLAAYSEQIESSLWTAIRTFEETALFLDALSSHVGSSHGNSDSASFAARAAEARRHSAALRQIVNSREPLVGEAQKVQ